MAARAVIVGVVFYCLIAWAAVFKIVSVGWEALKPNPVHYAQQNNERTE